MKSPLSFGNLVSRILSVAALLAVVGEIHASGMITIQGKLVSITDKTYVVQTENGTYSVKKSAVPRLQADGIDRPRDLVSFTIPFDALDKMKPLKAK